MACIKDAELFNVLEAYGPEIISSNFQARLAVVHLSLLMLFTCTWLASCC